MKRCHYRIYAINPPRDLREQISAIHASAILKAGNRDGPIQGQVEKIKKPSGGPNKLKGS